MTKERPILFSGAMVRAILDGHKTQTRRILKQAVGPSLSAGIEHEPGVAELSWLYGDGPGHEVHERIKRVACPYGRPGDRLWVRETWSPRIVHTCYDMGCDCDNVWVDYVAGGEGRHFSGGDIPDDWHMPQAALKGRTVPSLHMPRWASRITLEITGVRVERLQDIRHDDAQSEGVTDACCVNCGESEADCTCSFCMPDYRDAYRGLWEQINGADSWAANPWVWVVEFRRAAAAMENAA